MNSGSDIFDNNVRLIDKRFDLKWTYSEEKKKKLEWETIRVESRSWGKNNGAKIYVAGGKYS